MTFTTRLIWRDSATHSPLIEQAFPRVFSTPKTAEKYLESRVSGMKAITFNNVSIYGQVINENGKIETGILLF